MMSPDHWTDPETLTRTGFRPTGPRIDPPLCLGAIRRRAHKCIGLHFSTMQVKVFMALLLRRFRVELARIRTVVWKRIPIPAPKGGLPIRLIPLGRADCRACKRRRISVLFTKRSLGHRPNCRAAPPKPWPSLQPRECNDDPRPCPDPRALCLLRQRAEAEGRSRRPGQLGSDPAPDLRSGTADERRVQPAQRVSCARQITTASSRTCGWPMARSGRCRSPWTCPRISPTSSKSGRTSRCATRKA